MSMSTSYYRLSALDNIEQVEDYKYGGFHPVSLGDIFDGGKYRVLHKLGFGGSSTIWLARNESSCRLVSLKIITAEASQQCKELAILQHLTKSAPDHPGRACILSLLDHFNIRGPNGTHLCLVYPFAGPSVAQITDSPGEVAGSRRLCSPLARKVEKQVALALDFLHASGVIHGDLTTSNVLFQLKDADSWTDQDINKQLGAPATEQVHTLCKEHSATSAPEYLVEPANVTTLEPRWFTNRVALIDFGESLLTDSLSSSNGGLGTPFSYSSPELIFENRVSKGSDMWALGCTIFEIQAGAQIFASFFGGPDEVIRQMVQTLGKLPEPWWSSWECRYTYFNDDGKPKTHWPNNIPLAVHYPLRAQIEDIGADGDESVTSSMLEPPGSKLSELEVDMFEDLLQRVITYTPEQRLSVDQVLTHPWLGKIHAFAPMWENRTTRDNS